MQLMDVRIDRFGTLNSVAIERLSPRITVFWGSNGSGKSTFVRFLRGLLYGYRHNTPWTQSELNTESGHARVQTPGGIRTLRRFCTAAGTEQFTQTDEFDRQAVFSQGNSLPAWVTEDVFREVFTVGYAEAERFELLTRLCLECESGRGEIDPELRQAEAALLQTIRDRDGNSVQGGVVHRISELRRRQGDLQNDIAALRRPAADLPLRIEQLVREIDAATASIERIDLRLREIDAEILRLEQLLIELRRRNILPLNRQMLEGELRTVTARLDRWREIRGLVERERVTKPIPGDGSLRPAESARTIRALVSRLEERTQSLTERHRSSIHPELERHQDTEIIRQLRNEVAALCAYVGQYEQATTQHVESLQKSIAERTSADAAEMESLLSAQITSLRAELARAENVLADTALPKHNPACRFTGHQELNGSSIQGLSGYHTVAEVESQLERLRAERLRLLAERGVAEETRNGKRILLERLRQELVGTATLEQLDTLRSHIAQLDAEIALLEDHRRQLDRTESSLREVIERLKVRSHSRVLDLASQFVQRLTDGECRRVSASLPDRIFVQTNHTGEELALQQLSRGTRDQVGLALRLALIQVRAETQGPVPLILDDVFVASDDARANAAVRLLTELAQRGQQILFFTCQKDVRDLFARFNADVRNFDNRVELPKAVAIVPTPITPPPVLHAYVEPPVEIRQIVAPPVVQPVPTEPELHPNGTNWLFYLEVDHGVEDLAGITLGELEALRTSGILTIDDLLSRTVPQLQETARQKGFQLSVDRLHALCGQAELTTRVPMLRRSDAALLYASGIRSVDELSRLRPETVYDRVTNFQRSESGSRHRRGGRLIDRQQSINWARFGQFARTLDEARHSRSRFSVRPGSRTTSKVSHHGLVGATPLMSRDSAANFEDDHEFAAGRGERPAGTQTISRRRRVISGDADVEERRARRLARRRRQTSRLRTATAQDNDGAEAVEQSGGLRFFLNRVSHIEKAPSIGPRTASMLEAIGIHTVEDLMNMTPERISEMLNHRRLTPSIIQQWQQQSRMMCQVPELRGHDAQILVACGITTPEDLAAKKPASLLAIVEPFARTKEGERIIRNGKVPDLTEVTEWIQWAANARAFKAA